MVAANEMVVGKIGMVVAIEVHFDRYLCTKMLNLNRDAGVDMLIVMVLVVMVVMVVVMFSRGVAMQLRL